MLPATAALAALDPELLRDTADRVLARPEFADPGDTLYQRILDWLAEQIGRLLLQAGGRGGQLVAGILLLALVGVLVLLVLRFTRTVRHTAAQGLEITVPTGRTAADWAAEAAEHEAAGRWREALRARYAELVAELGAAGVIEEVPGRTTGEHAAAVSAALPEGARPFAALTRRFEDAWYGHRPVTADDHAHAVEDAAAVRAAAGLRTTARRPVGAAR